MDNRRAYAIAAVLVLIILAAALVLYPAPDADSGIRVREHKLRIWGGDAPIRLAFISDAHVETQEDSLQLAEAVEKINQLQADYIILGGDFAGESEKNLMLLEPLLRLENRENVFVVLGNHDYKPADALAEEYAKWLTERNFTVLRNQDARREDVCFIGLEPERSFRPPPDKADIGKAYEGVDENCKTIVISHSPEILLLPDLWTRRTDLIISGHTHGVEAAFVPWPIKSMDGSYDLGGRRLIITSGVTKDRGLLEKATKTKPEIALIEIL